MELHSGKVWVYKTLQNFADFMLDLACRAAQCLFQRILPSALGVNAAIYFMHGRASCAGEPCFSAGAGRGRGQETIQAPGILEARLLQIFDHGGRRCGRRPLQGALMAGHHGLIHSLICILFFWRMLCCFSLSGTARRLVFLANMASSK